MALLFCTRCGHRVSDRAPKCPACGIAPYRTRIAQQPTQMIVESSSTVETNAGTALMGVNQYRSAATYASERLSDPLDIRIPVGNRLQLPSVAVGVVAAAGSFALLIWFFWYWPVSPSHTLYGFCSALKAHNGVEASSYVDFDKVVKKFTNDYLAEARKTDPEASAVLNSPLGGLLIRGILGAANGSLAEGAQTKFENWVEQPDRNGPLGTLGNMDSIHLIGLMWKLRHQDDMAFVDLQDPKTREPFQLILTRESDSRWRFVGLDGPAVRQVIDEAIADKDPNDELR
jgi:hypothetical protein